MYRNRIFKEVRYFSRDGSTMPNGIGFQRGNFLHEGKVNKEAFDADGAVSGIIVFPSPELDTGSISDIVGAHSVGNVFKGKYVGKNDEVFDEHSTTIAVAGLSSKELLRLAANLAGLLHQQSVLVKDTTKNKILIGVFGIK